MKRIHRKRLITLFGGGKLVHTKIVWIFKENANNIKNSYFNIFGTFLIHAHNLNYKNLKLPKFKLFDLEYKISIIPALLI